MIARSARDADARVRAIVSAYFEIASEGVPAADAREFSVAVAMVIEVEDLFVVGRAVRDPQPWVPFLKCLRSISTRDARVSVAERRLYRVAREMLRMQRLLVVRPEDCLARPTPFEEAFSSLLSNTI